MSKKKNTASKGSVMRALSFMMLMVAVSSFGASPAWSSLEAGEDYVPGELVVGYAASGSEKSFNSMASERASINSALGASVVESFDYIQCEVVKIPDNLSLQQAAEHYGQYSSVRYVEPNYIYRALLEPNDPRYGQLWGMERIRAEQAWDATTGSSNFVMAVVDTGIQYDHEDLADNMWTNPGEIPDNGIDDDGNGYVDDVHGWNAADDDGDVYPRIASESHGSHVAGTIGAVGDNSLAIVGVNWDIQIVSLRFLTETGTGSIVGAVRAIEYIIDNEIQLSNNSWGGGGRSQALYDAIRRAGEEVNHLFVAAAGNDSNDNDANPSYPASYQLDNIISVAAISETANNNEDPELAGFSNYGAESVDIAAPGVNILSTVPFNDYAAYQGTSMASPHVAGAAALIWSQQPDLPLAEIQRAIYEGARPSDTLDGLVALGAELDLAGSLGIVGAGITLDRKAYRPDAEALVTVSDPAVPQPSSDPEGTNAVAVAFELRNPDGDLKYDDILELQRVDETPDFETVVDLADPAIPALEDDTILVSYTNRAGTVFEASAFIDATPPVISGVRMYNETEDGATVEWYTDEPADSFVLYSQTLPLTGAESQGSTDYSEEPVIEDGATNYFHRVDLEGLESFSVYYLAVQSSDYAGNTATEPTDLNSLDPEDYIFLVTKGRFDLYVNDMDDGELDWVAGSAYGQECWQFGVPTYRPASTHTGSECWGTVLDGRYPSNVNAWVESGLIEDVELNPRISFWSWHEIAPAESEEEGYEWDFGQIEVNTGSGWMNVTQYADISDSPYLQGASDWQEVLVDLTGVVSNTDMRVRFRLESDNEEQAAGWLIDDFKLSHQLSESLVVMLEQIIDDSEGGDGDGYAEPGETFYLDLELFNSSSTRTFSNVVAQVGIADSQADLIRGESQDYGDLGPGESYLVEGRIEIKLSASAVIGDTIELFHSLSAQGGVEQDQIIKIRVEDRESVFGRVLDTLGAPIEAATVWARSDDGELLEATSSASGDYQMHGFIAGETYSLWAGKPGEFSPSEPVDVVAPAAGRNIVLGQAYANPDPDTISLALRQGESNTVDVEFDNTSGNIAYDASPDFESDAETDWVEFDTASLDVAAGSSGTLGVVVSAGDMNPGIYEGTIVLEGNDIGGTDVVIPIDLEVQAGAVLDLVSVDVVDPDGDGYLEPGETVTINLAVENNGADSSGFLSGRISTTSTWVNITADQATWPDTAPGSSSDSMLDPTLTADPAMPDGAVVPFTLAVENSYGEWAFEFAITSSVRYAVSGQVDDGSASVAGAVIEIISSDGDRHYRATTDVAGDYVQFGIVPGEYTVRCTPPAPYKMPPSSTLDIDGDKVVDFTVADWGMDVSPTEISEGVDEGRSVLETLMISNGGTTDGQVYLNVELKRGIADHSLYEPTYPDVDWAALDSEDYKAGRLIVGYASGVTGADRQRVMSLYPLSEVKTLDSINATVVEFPASLSVERVARELSSDPAVKYVEPDYLVQLYRRPNDPLYGELYAMRNVRQTGGTKGADIRAEEAWNTTVGDTNVVVAVVDSGCDTTHEDLIPNLVPGENFSGDSFGNVDIQGHGTHVAGTIAAAGDNGIGVSGVSWNSKIMPCRIFGALDPTNTPVSAAIEAIEYAVERDVKVSNHSWGGLYFSGALYDSIQHANTNDMILVCAAGNSGWDNDVRPHYPSSYNLPNIISVAATDHNDALSWFSCYGAESVDIAAPGEDILSTIPEFSIFDGENRPMAGLYETMSGTSMAAPHVSGVVALLMAQAPWATADMIRTAVLEGGRSDPDLAGVVSSGSHLDAPGALRVISAPWIQLDPQSATVPAGGTLPVEVTLNAGEKLSAGVYEADIEIVQGNNSIVVPVSLTVNPAPMPQIDAVNIEAGDGDPYAEPGETFDLSVSVANNGSLLLSAFTGTLSSTTPGVTINSNTANWNGISSGEVGNASFSVTLDGTVSDSAEFTLTIDDGERDAWELNFSIDVAARGSIMGTVRDGQGNGVDGAAVEFIGAAGGSVTTDPSGDYRIDGLPETGTFRLRVVSDQHSTTDLETVLLAGNDAVHDFTLLQPEVELESDSAEMAVQWPLSGTLDLSVTNSSADLFEFEIYEIPHTKAAIISDGDPLPGLADRLSNMGLDVEVYSNNYELVSTPYMGQQGLSYSLDPTTYYSSDDSIVLTHDLVILDLAGASGEGRMLQDDENELFEQYLERGGCLIVTGSNPLSQPDNTAFAQLAGLENADRAQDTVAAAESSASLAGNAYIDIDAGDKVAVDPQVYDLATPTNGADRVLFSAGSASKIIYHPVPEGGRLYYWGGNLNGSEWEERNVWLDVLRDIVLSEFAANVEWLDAFPAKTQLQSESAPITILFNDDNAAEVGEYSASLLLRGNYAGAEDRLLEVELQVVDPTLTVQSSSGVTDWMGNPVSGDGGSGSAIYQVIWSGMDGVPAAPDASGRPLGDDVLLGQYPSGNRYSRFGKGYPLQPDSGLFRDRFSHEISPEIINRKVYVRAWDSTAPSVSVAYGDSGLYEIQNLAFETNDFGSWIVDQVVDYPGYRAKDSNGDSVPDGWYIERGLDPRLPLGALEQRAEQVAELGTYGTNPGQLWEPRRVALSGSLLFALDTRNNRIQVWDVDSGDLLQTFSPGTLSQPYGMAVDPRAGVNRLVVADTNNDRISVFEYDPNSGALTPDFSFGSNGVAAGEMNAPRALGVDSLGSIYVADTQNRRVQKFSADGLYQSQFSTGGDSLPEGICVDADGLVYVADTGRDRVGVYTGAGTLMGTITGVEGAGQFVNPTDVRIGVSGNIFVADKNRDRVQIFYRDGLDFIFVLSFGETGTGQGQFNQPYGVAPARDDYYAYVADTYNNRVQKFELLLDSDGDGIDDGWELANGLDPYDPADALQDDDSDGLLNIGEYRIGFDPQNRDMDGDGQSDGSEIWTGNDPLDPEWGRLRVTRNIMGDSAMQVLFVVESNKTYAVERSEDLVEDDWTEVPDSEFTAPVNGLHMFTAPISIEEFFRPIEK